MKSLFLAIAIFGAAVIHAQEVHITRGPYLQAASPNSITICWRTSIPTQGVVWFGTKTLSKDAVVDTAFTIEHRVRLEGLLPSTKYMYAIGDAEMRRQQKAYVFNTLPPVNDSTKFTVAAFGDCGNGARTQRRVRNRLMDEAEDERPDAWLLLGDNAYQNGTDAEYQRRFFNIYKNSLLPRFPLFPSPGNHDYANDGGGARMSDSGRAYYQSFHLPVHGESGGIPSGNPAYYAFDIGAAHFISLDSYGREASGMRLADEKSNQFQWLRKELEASKNRPWVIVFFHHPPYTMGSHSSDREHELAALRNRLVPLLESYSVDLVLCGHSHSYERSFLINGHYGMEASFKEQHKVSPEHCIIPKEKGGKGTMYVVCGTGGQHNKERQPNFPHDAMYVSRTGKGGALWITGDQHSLQVKWLLAGRGKGDCVTLHRNRKALP